MKKVLSLALALSLIAIVFVACSTDDGGGSSQPTTDPTVATPGESSVPSGKGWSLALLYSEITGDFWSIVKAGGDQALSELADRGVEGYITAPATTGDHTLQAEQIDAALLLDVDGIVLCPSNADSIGTYVTDTFTDDVGVPIVLIDRSLNTESKFKVTQVAADTYTMGEEVGQLATEAMGGEGYYVAIGIDTNNQNWYDRSYGAIDWMTDNAPGMQNAIPNEGSGIGKGVFWSSQNPENATIPYVQDVCSNNKDKDLVFMTANEAGTNNVINALTEIESQRGDRKTRVVGFDFSETGYGYLDTNDMYYGAVGQNPYLMGYNSTFILVDILDGKTVDKFIPVPHCAVTRENIDSKEVKEYLDSMNISIG